MLVLQITKSSGKSNGGFGEPIPSSEVLAALEKGASRGETELNLAGDLRVFPPDLPEWIAAARALGYVHVAIETDAVHFASPRHVTAVVEAGLTHAQVTMPAASERVYARVTRRPGVTESAWRGTRQLMEQGVSVSLLTRVWPANAAELPAILERAAAELPSLERVLLRPGALPKRVEAVLAEMDEDKAWRFIQNAVLTIPQLAELLPPIVEQANRLGVPLTIEPAGRLPLCAFPSKSDAISCVKSNKGQSEVHPDCVGCALTDRCEWQGPVTGIDAAFRVAPFRTVPLVVRRSSRAEPVMIFSGTGPSFRRPVSSSAEIRVTMPCNQRCTFCFVNRDAPDASREELERSVDEAVARGVGAVIFTGGEPTLSPHLPDLIARTTAQGVPVRGIQTNALKLAEGDLADRLVDAGLTLAHVSLHAVDPGKYLAITGYGTPEQAARGAQRLAERGVEVTWSLVINQANGDHVGETVRFLHQKVPDSAVVLSVARETPDLHRPWDDTLLSYGEASRALVEGLRVGEAIGVPVYGAGNCAFPPCLLSSDELERFGERVALGLQKREWKSVRSSENFEEVERGRQFVPSCGDCAIKSRCQGIGRAYLDRFGSAEFVPVRNAPSWDS